MTFLQTLAALPHLTTRGIDHPDRIGFKTSRALLSADADGFKFVSNWLENHTIRSTTTHNVPREIENTTGRRVSHGVVVAAVRAQCIPFKSVYGLGLKF